MKIPTNYKSQLGPSADFLLNREWLIEKYKQLSTRQIGQLIGCGKKAVSTALKRHNIPIQYGPRITSTSKHESFISRAPQSAIGKLDNHEWLYYNYIIINRSFRELAIETGVSERCVRKWLKRFNIIKDQQTQTVCSIRRYTESQGYTPSSIAACKKRMSGKKFKKIHTNKAGLIICHSSWEESVAVFLDSCDQVITFTKDSIRIPYVFDGKNRTYYPDFMVKFAEKILIVEVKAERLLADVRVRAKLAALADYCDRYGFVPVVLSGRTRINPNEILRYQ